MVKLQHKYSLRPRNRGVAISQMKKILPRSEIDEIVSKNVEKKTEKTNIMDIQHTKTKVAEIPTVKTQKVKVPAMETKPSPQRKDDNKGTEAQTIENDKIAGSFNVKNEINKIKIPIPLFKLAKTPSTEKKSPR
jgi:hypothetical protein